MNGNKFWITNGPDADIVVVYAKTDKRFSFNYKSYTDLLYSEIRIVYYNIDFTKSTSKILAANQQKWGWAFIN